QLLGGVTAVGVHLHEHRVAVLEPPPETGDVGGTETVLLGAVQHRDALVGGGEFVGEVTGAVGAAVVDDEDVGVRQRSVQPRDDPTEVLPLVVGRNDHQGASARCAVVAGRRRRCHQRSSLSNRPPAGAPAAPVPEVVPAPAGVRRDRTRAATAAATAPAQSTSSGAAPSRLASVTSARSGTCATRAAGSNSGVLCCTRPSGSTIALTPLVAATTTVRPCSTARTRDIASC